MKTRKSGVPIIAALALLASVTMAFAAPDSPRLVLQITVDQLRGDLPGRYADRLPDGGFRYLMEKGTWYTDAHYQHANTETAVGHATLATGADPSRHGIVANDWIDQGSGAFVYNTEDDRHHIVGKEPKAHEGVSPRNLLASTIPDEMLVHNGGRSRAFSVSVKDRGAILPGGHVGKAFWFSKSSGEFVTSTYYYDDYPAWVKQWNAAKPADAYRDQSWDLLHDRATYVHGQMDDRPYEADLKPLGRTFPHSLGGDTKYFYLFLTLSPVGDALTLDFAKALVENEKLGQNPHGAPDYLQISFSSTDYIGHLFGPSSLETEDNLLRLDRTLADLFQFIDEKVGLDQTLIVLSGDHGAPEAPEYMAELGLSTGRFAFDWFKTEGPLTDALQKKYGRSDFISGHSHPYLYLNLEAIASAGQNVADVERLVADELMKIPGIVYAQTRSDLLAGRITESPVQNQIRRSFHPTRSGNIHMVPEQYWFLHSTEEAEKMGIGSIAAIHGSPWAYDTYVPIFFAGHGVPAQIIGRRVAPTDIAATVTAYLGVKRPSGSVGSVLTEVLP
ncbi:MAG: alkaline phosphatase family protein [Desulfobacteraceae bacterium]|nr:alkaline phosphatase family protein [Desulfobacteraceae bacterium]MBC2751628.1 alkaline phosphatase family protein [Desulfobacteraceae bacterium]